MKHAVIYCRVSSKKQVKEGHGLTSQESTCRKYASTNGLIVQRVFTDDFSGGGDFWFRPGIRKLLEYLDDQELETAVIFDDIKRFARDTVFHLKLRQELSVRNAYPLCPTFRFEDTPEGEFVETVIAATAQLERQQNRRQVIRRMKARFQAGHWMFPPPLGYKRVKKNGVKLMVPDESSSKVVRKALERFAKGQLPTQRDVARYLEAKGCRSKWSQGGGYSFQAIQRFLSNELYCGWCVCDKWKMRVRGVHKPLISEATHRQIRARLSFISKEPVRQDICEEFPLRGHVRCAVCDRAITAYWAQGRSKKYPYYRCASSGCINIRAEKMETRFTDRLQEAVPSPVALGLFETDLREIFQDRQKVRSAQEQSIGKRLTEIGQETKTFMRSLGRASNPSTRKLYEDQIEKLQTERERLEEQDSVEPRLLLDPVLEKVRELLENPLQYWKDGNLSQRRCAQQLVFRPPIPYDPTEGYRTAEFSLMYRVLGAYKKGKSSMVDLIGQKLNPVAEELQKWNKILKSE